MAKVSSSLATSNGASTQVLNDDAVRFHDETPEIASLYVDEAGDGIQQSSQIINSSTQNPRDGSATFDILTQHHAASSLSRLPRGSPEENPSPSSIPTYSTESARSKHNHKPSYAFSEREAILIRNFVENMALWVSVRGFRTLIAAILTVMKADITDPQRHFESDVPARAIKEPVLRQAIFAFSSRHLNRQNRSDVTEALQYHNQCVQLLISALSEPEHHITEDLLAAVAILRQHEEMDGQSDTDPTESVEH